MNKHRQVKHTIWDQMIKTNPEILEEMMKKSRGGQAEIGPKKRQKQDNLTDVGRGLSNQQSPSPGLDRP
jgi:hypothetical protein